MNIVIKIIFEPKPGSWLMRFKLKMFFVCARLAHKHALRICFHPSSQPIRSVRGQKFAPTIAEIVSELGLTANECYYDVFFYDLKHFTNNAHSDVIFTTNYLKEFTFAVGLVTFWWQRKSFFCHQKVTKFCCKFFHVI